jgi:hypothetical protein
MKKALSGFVGPVTIVLCLFFTGCAAVCTYESDSSSTNKYIGERSLRRVEEGRTTREWIVSAFGQPSETTRVSDNVELLKYHYSTNVERNVSLFLLFSSHTETEKVSNVYFELENGLVRRFWKD